MKFLKKKKLTVMIAAGLAGVSLGSVGFAGWVINATGVANQNVNVSFGSVTNNSYEAKLKTKAEGAITETNLVFDCAKVGAGTNGIIGEGNTEKLDVKFSFTIKNMGETQNGDQIFASVPTFTVKFESDLIKSLVDAKLVQSPVAIGTDTSVSLAAGSDQKKTDTSGTDKTTYQYTISHGQTEILVACVYHFAWGEAFDYVNPQECAINKAKAGLTQFKNLSNGQTDPKLNIKITPVLKTAA